MEIVRFFIYLGAFLSAAFAAIYFASVLLGITGRKWCVWVLCAEAFIAGVLFTGLLLFSFGKL